VSLRINNKISDEFAKLSGLLGIDQDSLLDYLNWCLLEHLVSELANDPFWKGDDRTRPNAIAVFRSKVEQRTGAKWDNDNILALFERVKSSTEKHYRQPITYAELLRLLINSTLKCANTNCGKSPPEVKLHIDHRFPSSKGGSSKFENLQFLCETCNLSKSNKLEKADIWLKLESLQLS